MNGDAEARGPERLAVLLIGEDPLARAGLAALLAGEPELEIVGQSAPGEEAAQAIERLRPQTLLWDLGSSWLHPQETPGEEGPPAVALLPREEEAARALAAGAQGVLLRNAGPARIAAALR